MIVTLKMVQLLSYIIIVLMILGVLKTIHLITREYF
jgi:hypothetical protein